MNVYEDALEKYNSGLFLQLEGSYGRYFVDTFIESGIIKMIDEPANTVIDGYNRSITLKKASIDYDRVNELWDDNPEFMEELEGGE
jgi:hypothetical protein|tara:strand:+ start:66 stop:323 length:258 start_codon:yes stop_codon:yes gene_type:complete